jgi:hypothetical protein
MKLLIEKRTCYGIIQTNNNGNDNKDLIEQQTTNTNTYEHISKIKSCHDNHD